MTSNKLPGILSCGFVGLLILTLIEQEVVTHATADKTLLHTGQRVDGMVDVK